MLRQTEQKQYKTIAKETLSRQRAEYYKPRYKVYTYDEAINPNYALAIVLTYN